MFCFIIAPADEHFRCFCTSKRISLQFSVTFLKFSRKSLTKKYSPHLKYFRFYLKIKTLFAAVLIFPLSGVSQVGMLKFGRVWTLWKPAFGRDYAIVILPRVGGSSGFRKSLNVLKVAYTLLRYFSPKIALLRFGVICLVCFRENFENKRRVHSNELRSPVSAQCCESTQ